MDSNGYYYKQGELISLPDDCEHSEVIGCIREAVTSGIVRIRDHGNMVSFQGRSKRLVNTAFKKFCDNVRVPSWVAFEYPGTYEEF